MSFNRSHATPGLLNDSGVHEPYLPKSPFNRSHATKDFLTQPGTVHQDVEKDFQSLARNESLLYTEQGR